MQFSQTANCYILTTNYPLFIIVENPAFLWISTHSDRGQKPYFYQID